MKNEKPLKITKYHSVTTILLTIFISMLVPNPSFAEQTGEEKKTEPTPPPPPVEPSLLLQGEAGKEENTAPPAEKKQQYTPPFLQYAGEDKGVKIITGSLFQFSLSSTIQSLLAFVNISDEEDSEKRNLEFQLQTLRLKLKGGFYKNKIGLIMRADFTNLASPVLDACGTISPLKGLSFKFGRFAPNYSYFMPKDISDIMMIHYPLLTQKLGMFRQTGAQLTFREKLFGLIAGVFNGPGFRKKNVDLISGAPAQDTSVEVSDIELEGIEELDEGLSEKNLKDENMEKDIFVRIFLTPITNLQLAGYLWYGMPQFSWYDSVKGRVTNDRANLVIFGFEASYVTKIISFIIEYSMRRIYYPPKSQLSKLSLASHGALVHLGYKVTRGIEFMIRGDYFDHNIDSEFGREVWGSIGINFYPYELKSKLTFEYILKSKQRKDELGKPQNYLTNSIYLQMTFVI